MKKILLFFGLLMFMWQSNAQTYCTDGGPSNQFDTNVESVDLAGETTAIAYLGCQASGLGVTGVEDQTAQVADLIAGNTYTIDVQFGTCGGNFGWAGELWLDFDRDFVFDPTESLGTATGTGNPGSVSSYTFTVPAGAINGSTRLRVMQWEGGSNPLDPCASFFYGSVVDLGISVSGGVDILCDFPFNPALVETFDTSAEFSWDPVADASNGYVWEVYAQGADPAVDSSVANGTFPTGTSGVVTGLTELSDYDFYIASDCDADGLSDFNGPISFSTIATCPDPTNITIGSVADVTASVTWVESFAAVNGYAWEVYAQGDTPGVDPVVSSGTFPTGTSTGQLTGLTAQTSYDLYMSSDCGADGQSVLNGPISFTTACSVFTAPYFNDFENFTATTTFNSEECWSENSTGTFGWDVSSAGTPSLGTGPNSAFSGSNFLFTEASSGSAGNEALLVSPLIDLSALTNPALSFYFHMFGDDMDSLNVDVDAGSGYDLNVLTLTGQQQANQGDAWIQQFVDLTAYTGQTVTVRFRVVRGASFEGDVSIDDVSVDEAPSCFAPINVVVSNLGSDSADVTWSEVSNATNGYNWELYLAGEDPATATATQSGNLPFGTTNVSLTGLGLLTAYDFYVSADCDNGGVSSTVGPVSFTTIPPNDNACGAIPLTVGVVPPGDTYSNFAATEELNEPVAACFNGGIDGSVWFTFVAPASGEVEVSTDIAGGTLTDTELAVYDAPTDCADLSTFGAELGCGQDEGVVVGFNSIVNLTGLVAGNTYYIQVDTWGGAPQGTFGISVLDTNPPCPNPENVQFISSTTTTADFSWDDVTAETDGYNWYVFDFGADTSSDTPLFSGSVGADVTTVNVTGLSSSTTYQFYVEANCGAANGLSILSDAVTFSTECDAFQAPYFEDFSAFTVTTAFDDDGCWTEASPGGFAWDVGTGQTPSTATGPSGAQFGANYLFAESSSGVAGDEAIVLSPQVDLTNLTEPSLSFWYHMFGATMGTLHVDIDDGTNLDLSVFSITGEQQTSLGDAWIEVIIDLNAYAGQTIQARFRAERGTSFTSDMAIDGVKFDELPTCLAVTNLLATNIGDTTADMSWTGNSTAVSYNWEVYLSGDDPAVDAPVLTGTEPNSSFTLTGLTASTTYDFYVTTDCGADGLSGTTGPLTFSTATCPFTDQCDHTFILNDSFGDGWNGNTMDVIQNGIVVATLGSGFTTGNTFTEIVSLCDGANFELFWNAGGSFVNEVGVQIIDPFGEQLYELIPAVGNSNNTSLFTGTVSCTPPPCPKPSNLSVTNLLDVSVTLNWDDNGNAVNGYTWFIFALGSDPSVDAPLFSGTTPDGVTTVDVTGLTQLTDYEFYVEADCGTDGLSDISNPFPFSTPCSIFVAPYFNDFEAFPATTSLTAADCWTEASTGAYTWDVSNAGTGSFGTGPNSAFSGTNFVFTEASSGGLGDEAILISPLVDLSTLSSPALSFWYHMHGGDMGTINVDVDGGAGFDLAVFSLSGEQQPNQDDAWIQQYVDLSAYSGQIVTVRLRAERGAGFESDISIDDFRIDEAPSCLSPTGLSFSNEGINSVDIAWNPVGNATTGYNWFVYFAGDDPDVATPFLTGSVGVGVTTATITGLNPATTYDIYVQSDCGAVDGTSELSNSVTFQTLCAPILAPYFNDFEGFSAGDLIEQECWIDVTTSTFDWEVSNAGTGSFATGPNQAFSGTNFLFTEASSGLLGDEALLESPEIDLSALGVPALSFYYHMHGGDMGTLHIDVNAGNGYDLSVFSLVGEQQPNQDDEWIQQFVDLSAYAGQTVTIRFRGERGDGFEGDMSIDDVRVDEAPTCFDPVGLTTISVTDITADLSWVAGSSETVFDVEIVPAGSAPTGVPTFEDVTLPFTATGLSPETDYDFYVRADCGPGDVSNWVGPSPFTTTFSPIIVTVNAPPINNTYCYGNNEFKEWLFTSSDGTTPVEINFNSGTIEDGTGSTDRCRIFDGFDTTAPVLYDSDVDGTDMAGVTVIANSGTAYMLLESDIFGSCQGGVDDEDLLDFDVFAGTISTVEFSAENFRYFPNPVENQLNIESSSTIESIELFDISGKRVMNSNFNNTNIALDLEALSSGVYMMKVKIGSASQTFKVVKR
jgi:hypothetical protein